MSTTTSDFYVYYDIACLLYSRSLFGLHIVNTWSRISWLWFPRVFVNMYKFVKTIMCKFFHILLTDFIILVFIFHKLISVLYCNYLLESPISIGASVLPPMLLVVIYIHFINSFNYHVPRSYYFVLVMLSLASYGRDQISEVFTSLLGWQMSRYQVLFVLGFNNFNKLQKVLYFNNYNLCRSLDTFFRESIFHTNKQ